MFIADCEACTKISTTDSPVNRTVLPEDCIFCGGWGVISTEDILAVDKSARDAWAADKNPETLAHWQYTSHIASERWRTESRESK